jgi:hypothetical protein
VYILYPYQERQKSYCTIGGGSLTCTNILFSAVPEFKDPVLGLLLRKLGLFIRAQLGESS